MKTCLWTFSQWCCRKSRWQTKQLLFNTGLLQVKGVGGDDDAVEDDYEDGDDGDDVGD